MKKYFLFVALVFGFSSCIFTDRHVDEDKSSYFVYSKFGTQISFRKLKVLGNGFAVPPIPIGATYTKMDVDVKTFEVMGGYLAKDKNHVYWQTVIMAEADATTFRIDSTGTLRDKKHIYDWHHQGTYPRIIEGIDAETYVRIYKYRWGRDKSNIYYGYKPLDVDVQTFEVLNDNTGYDRSSIYEFDNKHSLKITPAEGKLVRLAERVLHDNKTVFVYCSSTGPSSTGKHKIPIKNVSSVKYYGTADYSTLWGVDGTVYWDAKDMKEEDVDEESFKFVGFRYAKDRNQVYFNGEILWDADPNTFIVRERFLACDKKTVFMGSKKVEGADPATVRLEKDDSVPVDKNYRFRYDQRKWIIDRDN